MVTTQWDTSTKVGFDVSSGQVTATTNQSNNIVTSTFLPTNSTDTWMEWAYTGCAGSGCSGGSVGYTTNAAPDNDDDFEFSFLIHPVYGLNIKEEGTNRISWQTYSAPIDLKITTTGSVLKYYVNGSLLYTSTVSYNPDADTMRGACGHCNNSPQFVADCTDSFSGSTPSTSGTRLPPPPLIARF